MFGVLRFLLFDVHCTAAGHACRAALRRSGNVLTLWHLTYLYMVTTAPHHIELCRCFCMSGSRLCSQTRDVCACSPGSLFFIEWGNMLMYLAPRDILRSIWFWWVIIDKFQKVISIQWIFAAKTGLVWCPTFSQCFNWNAVVTPCHPLSPCCHPLSPLSPCHPLSPYCHPPSHPLSPRVTPFFPVIRDYVMQKIIIMWGWRYFSIEYCIFRGKF